MATCAPSGALATAGQCERKGVSTVAATALNLASSSSSELASAAALSRSRLPPRLLPPHEKAKRDRRPAAGAPVGTAVDLGAGAVEAAERVDAGCIVVLSDRGATGVEIAVWVGALFIPQSASLASKTEAQLAAEACASAGAAWFVMAAVAEAEELALEPARGGAAAAVAAAAAGAAATFGTSTPNGSLAVTSRSMPCE